MKYFLLLFFLTSCYSAKKASNQIDKAYSKYPSVVANKAHNLFPCDTLVHSIDSSEIVDFKAQIDAINDFYLAGIKSNDTITLKDTQFVKFCNNVIVKYRTIYKSLPRIIDTIKIKDNAEIFIYKTKYEKCDSDNKQLHLNYTNSLKFILLLLILITIYSIYKWLTK